jgi:hypothetical protein
MAEGQSELHRRKWPLYTSELTPMCEVSDELWAVIRPIISPEGAEPAERRDPYPWLSRLDATRREEFVDYCVELDCWHEELEFAADDLQTATEFWYTSDLYENDAPHYRRLALIYHSDNVDHRVYAYREKVFQFVSLFFGSIASSDRREDLKGTVKAVLSRMGHQRVLTLLNRLENDPKTRPVADALARRRKLVHALAIRRWKTLQARRRVEEFVIGLKVGDAAEQLANLEALIKEGREELERLCNILALFREDLVAALKESTTPRPLSASE